MASTIMNMKPYKLPKMSSKEISKLLEKEKICRIAFKGEVADGYAEGDVRASFAVRFQKGDDVIK